MRFWLAVAILVGTIVGVGIFGLPAVINEAGWDGMLAVTVLGVSVVVLTHMAYAHVVILTRTRRRLPGYAREWMGKGAECAAFFSQSVGLVGSSLAYLMVGGVFLAQAIRIFMPFSDWAGIALYFIAGAVLVRKGVRSIAESELVMVVIMLCAIAVLGGIVAPRWEFANLMAIDAHGGPWRAYGVLLFSLWGMAVIPEAAELVPRKRISAVVAVGVFASLLISIVFVVIVMGVSHVQVRQDALSGLVAQFGLPAQLFGYAFGVLATFTSYLTLSRNTVDMFTLDFKVAPLAAWFLALGVPLILLLAGIQDFVTVIAVTGAVSLGMEGVLALCIERKAVEANPRGKVFYIPHWLRWVAVALLSGGIAFELLATLGYL